MASSIQAWTCPTCGRRESVEFAPIVGGLGCGEVTWKEYCACEPHPAEAPGPRQAAYRNARALASIILMLDG